MIGLYIYIYIYEVAFSNGICKIYKNHNVINIGDSIKVKTNSHSHSIKMKTNSHKKYHAI